MTETSGAYAGEVDFLLEQVVQRLAADPEYMASLLATHRRQEGKSVESQQQLLGVDRVGFLRLELCRRPTGDASAFRGQVEQIAHYSGAQLMPLVQVIRRVDALAGMDLRAELAQGAGAVVVPPLPSVGFAPMAAARDRIGESQVEYNSPVPHAEGGDDAGDSNPPTAPAADLSALPAQRPTEAPDDRPSNPPEQPSENAGDRLA